LEEKRIFVAQVKKVENVYKVAQLTGVNESNLRRWSKEFDEDPLNFGKDLRTLNSGKRITHPLLEQQLL